MKYMLQVTIILVIGLIGHCSLQAAGDNSHSNDSIFRSYDFPSHPHLTHLCQQRVYGSGHEITWDAFASPAKPSKLVDYYRQKLGDAGLTRDGEGGSWGLPADAPRPKRVLHIKAVGSDNPSRACEKSPPPHSHSIIIVSRMD